MTDHATINTYATSANLGPLFDRAGAKLDGLYMTTMGQLTTAHGITVIRSSGRYPVPIKVDKSNINYKVAYGVDTPDGRHLKGIFEDFGIKDGLELCVINDIKPGGLGTSGAGAVAIVELINCLYQLNLTIEQKIKYALIGEPQQHPDNVVPCVIGGVVLSTKINGEELPRYSKLTPSPNLAYAVVIPTDIVKTGGTAKAREALNALRFTNPELVDASGLAELMIFGLIEGNFEKIRDAIKAYSKWEKSVTYVRNLPTEDCPNGVYGIDVLQLNQGLEAILGKNAVLTPSGAGPAMLILANDKDAAERAQLEVVKMYEAQGHPSKGFVASIRTATSHDDLTVSLSSSR